MCKVKGFLQFYEIVLRKYKCELGFVVTYTYLYYLFEVFKYTYYQIILKLKEMKFYELIVKIYNK